MLGFHFIFRLKISILRFCNFFLLIWIRIIWLSGFRFLVFVFFFFCFFSFFWRFWMIRDRKRWLFFLLRWLSFFWSFQDLFNLFVRILFYLIAITFKIVLSLFSATIFNNVLKVCLFRLRITICTRFFKYHVNEKLIWHVYAICEIDIGFEHSKNIVLCESCMEHHSKNRKS